MLFECYQPDDADRTAREIPFRELIFARQMIVVGELLRDLPPEDRVSPIVGMLIGVVDRGGELRVEVPDTNESKELMKFCRKLTVYAARRDARAEGADGAREPDSPGGARVLHRAGLLLRWLPYSNNNSPFYMGIPRLRFPADAPSRSTLKLEEAFHVFIPADEWDERGQRHARGRSGRLPGRLDLSAGETQYDGAFGG